MLIMLVFLPFLSSFSAQRSSVASEEQRAAVDFGAVVTLRVAALLDGKTMPHESTWTTISFFGNLANNATLKTPNAKGGAKAGAAIAIAIAGFCPEASALGLCVVRLRGSNFRTEGGESTGSFVTADGELRSNAISFLVPGLPLLACVCV